MSARVSLITGGANGIGGATARLMAARGDRVVIADVDTDRGTALARECGGLFIRADATSMRDNERVVAKAVNTYGRLDAVVLNVGAPGRCGPRDFTPRRYRDTLRTNLDSAVFGMQACLPHLRRRRSGSIVITASIAGLTTSADVYYAASKHALIGLVRSVAPLLRDDGIRVNSVCPGLVDTRALAAFRTTLVSHGLRLARAEEVATVIDAVLRDDRTGQAWIIQAGRSAVRHEYPEIPLATTEAA